MTNEPNALQTPRTSFTTYAWAAALAALAGFAAVYVTLRGADNANPDGAASAVVDEARPAAAAANQALPSGPGANPLSVGSMAAFVFKKSPEPVPDTPFLDASGKERSIKDWAGKVVLLNLWATWCAPCRKEMPSLDRLQAQLGSDRFEVVAVSVDKTGIDGAKKFLDDIKVAKLGAFADPTIRLGTALKAIGMPSSLIIDAQGREVGRLVGPAEWDSDEAKRLIAAILK
ncbi:MAG: TlpA family protein disulfide reductase [Bacteroidota bacterium]